MGELRVIEGTMPGIAEEAFLSLESGQPLFLVGVASEVVQETSQRLLGSWMSG